MDIPKPHPFKSSVTAEPRDNEVPSGVETFAGRPKHEFVLQPHMVNRPLRNNEALMDLRKSMTVTNSHK